MLNIDNIIRAVIKGNVVWRHHSKIRMGQRNFIGREVKTAILNGDIIERYENDKPFPSFLIFGMIGKRPVHVVAAYDESEEMVYIVSLYEPNIEQFKDDYKTRREDNE